jgi:two-component system response regulator DesR
MRSALAPTRLTAEINVMSERVPGRGSVVRVLVAEDMRILRETLVALLFLEEDIEVVAQVADGPAILPAAIEHRPDVALLDIGLPGGDGLSAAAELARLLPGSTVVVLTALGTPEMRRRAAAAGVSGFLLKDAPAAALLDAVRSAAREAGSRRPG